METMRECELDALFAAWSEDRETGRPKPLNDWVARYPAYARDLAQWAADRPVAEWAEAQPVEAAYEARALKIGRQVVAEMRAQYMTQVAAPLTDLQTAAQAQGLRLPALARHLNVGVSVVMKLQNRLFRAASLPETLLSRLAEALQVSVAQVRTYLNQSPTLAAGAMYKADAAPKVAAQEDFSLAVEDCLDMTDEQKEFWRNAP